MVEIKTIKISKLLIWLSVIVFIIISASIGYMILLDVSFLDGLYMTIITISTVGYQEVGEMTPEAKIFSIGLILVSVGTIGYLASNVIRFFSESNINEAWRRNKMDKQIAQMTNHIIICGAGETGIHIVKQFKKRQIEFVVIDLDQDATETLKEMNVPHLYDDATKEEVLVAAGVKQARGLISTLAKDADNVFVVLTARELNPGLHIVARSHEEQSHKKLKIAGANNTVSPNEMGGRKMASMMLKPTLSHFMDHIIDTKDMSIDMEEVTIHELSELCKKTLREAKISEKTGLIVLAIRRDDVETFIFNPNAEEKLRPDDKMIVVGEKEQINKLKELAKDHV